jgi:hypothetical protein
LHRNGQQQLRCGNVSQHPPLLKSSCQGPDNRHLSETRLKETPRSRLKPILPRDRRACQNGSRKKGSACCRELQNTSPKIIRENVHQSASGYLLWVELDGLQPPQAAVPLNPTHVLRQEVEVRGVTPLDGARRRESGMPRRHIQEAQQLILSAPERSHTKRRQPRIPRERPEPHVEEQHDGPIRNPAVLHARVAPRLRLINVEEGVVEPCRQSRSAASDRADAHRRAPSGAACSQSRRGAIPRRRTTRSARPRSRTTPTKPIACVPL